MPPPTLESVYREHAGFVWRTLRRFGLSEADARDASQEVFLAVHRALPSFEGRCAMTTWLYAVCRSTVRDAKQRAFRKYEVSDDDGRAITRASTGDTPLAIAEERQRFAILLHLLSTLDPSQREVFALFELEGLRGEEISEMLEIPLATAHSRLRLARQAFREACARFQAAERFADRKNGVTS